MSELYHTFEFELDPPDGADAITAANGDDEAPASTTRTRFRATIKSSAFDRSNNSFVISAIRIPSGGVPLLWQHNQDDYPLGWVDNFQKTNTSLRAELQFNTDYGYGMWFAARVAEGNIRSVSGGFTGVERKMLDDEKDPDNYYYGWVYPPYYKGRTQITKSELVEVSLVNVPADRTARIRAELAELHIPTKAEIRAALGLPPLQG